MEPIREKKILVERMRSSHWHKNTIKMMNLKPKMLRYINRRTKIELGLIIVTNRLKMRVEIRSQSIDDRLVIFRKKNISMQLCQWRWRRNSTTNHKIHPVILLSPSQHTMCNKYILHWFYMIDIINEKRTK